MNFSDLMRKETMQPDILRRLRENDPTLTSISPYWSGVDPSEDIKALTKLLEVNHTICELRLSANYSYGYEDKHLINSEDAKVIAPIFEKNTTIRIFGLSPHKIDDEGSVVMARALLKNRTLTTFDFGGLKSWGFQVFAQVVAENRTLRDLNLGSSEIDEAAASSFSEALKVNTTLLNLNLMSLRTTSASLKILIQALEANQTLRKFTIAGMDTRIDNGVAIGAANALKKNKSLTSLSLQYHVFDDKGYQTLADALKVNHTLKTLFLGGHNNVRREGFEALTAALKINSALTELDLSYNRLEDVGIVGIAQALEIQHGLRRLTLGGSDDEFTDIGAAALGEALGRNKSLSILMIYSARKIGPKGLIAFARGLIKNNTLEELAIYECKTDQTVGAAWNETLKVNRKLASLTIPLDDQVIESMSVGLTKNKTLSRLNGWKNFTEIGAKTLAHVLSKNTSLTYLNLGSQPGVGQLGLNAIAHALEMNFTLLQIYCFIQNTEDIQRKLNELSKRNRELRKELGQAVQSGDLITAEKLRKKGVCVSSFSDIGDPPDNPLMLAYGPEMKNPLHGAYSTMTTLKPKHEIMALISLSVRRMH